MKCHLQVGLVENNSSVDGNSADVLRFRSRRRTSPALQYHSAGHAVGSRSRLFGECGWTRAFILFWCFTLPGDRRALQRTNLQFIIIKIMLHIPTSTDTATFRRSATTRRDDQHTCCCYYYFKLVFLLFDRISAPYILSNKDLHMEPTTIHCSFLRHILHARIVLTYLNIG